MLARDYIHKDKLKPLIFSFLAVICFICLVGLISIQYKGHGAKYWYGKYWEESSDHLETNQTKNYYYNQWSKQTECIKSYDQESEETRKITPVEIYCLLRNEKL